MAEVSLLDTTWLMFKNSSSHSSQRRGCCSIRRVGTLYANSVVGVPSKKTLKAGNMEDLCLEIGELLSARAVFREMKE